MKTQTTRGQWRVLAHLSIEPTMGEWVRTGTLKSLLRQGLITKVGLYYYLTEAGSVRLTTRRERRQ